MKSLEDLTPGIYGALLLTSMGASEEEVASRVKEAVPEESSAELVLKSAELIIEETLKHHEQLAKIISRGEYDAEAVEQSATDYLKGAGVNEQLIGHILGYNTFMHLKSSAEIMIEKGRELGHSEEQIKAQIKNEMGLESSMLEQVYEAAAVTIDGGFNTDEELLSPPKLKILKPYRPFIFGGITSIIFTYLHYQLEWDNEIIRYMAFSLGLISIGIGAYRARG